MRNEKVRAATERLEGPMGPCPDDAALLVRPRPDAVESHLVLCAECRGRAVDLADFFDGPREGEAPLTVAKPRLARLWMAAAACVLFGLGAGAGLMVPRADPVLVARVSEAERALAELRAPRLDAEVVDVFGEGTLTRGGGAGSNRMAVRAGQTVTLILNGAGVPHSEAYTVEIRGRGGNALWKGSGLRRGAQGNFSILVPGALLVGAGEIVLVGAGGSARFPLEVSQRP